jgi:alpha-beta hydrolase superfamily lysophospholipase
VKIVDGLKHHPLQEENADDVADLIVGWIGEHVGAGAG